MKQVAVVIPSWNTAALLARCLKALERSTLECETLVVDNASDDGSAQMVARDFPQVALLRNPINEGFAKACNQGLRASRAPLVLLLNSDTEVAEDAIALLARFLDSRPEYAAAAPRLIDQGGGTQRACMNLPNWSTPLWFGTPLERWFPRSAELARYFARDFDYERDGDAAQPPAAALLLRRSVLEALGGLDESMRLFFNDVDLSRRLLAAGWRTRYLCGARVGHVGGASTQAAPDLLERWHLDRLAYYRKHHGRIGGAWVKCCTSLAWLDFALRASLERVLPREQRIPQPLGPTTRAFVRFLGA